mmetsp:Transcript_49009/g.93652  ORF Transcript_49009/g.93652 Transcript_49009/m.93652 type:complete len:224 (-) Transcript_49009:1453-2124(-)
MELHNQRKRQHQCQDEGHNGVRQQGGALLRVAPRRGQGSHAPSHHRQADKAGRHEHPLADVLLGQVVVVLQPGVLERQQKRQPRVLKVHFLHSFDLEPLLFRKAHGFRGGQRLRRGSPTPARCGEHLGFHPTRQDVRQRERGGSEDAPVRVLQHQGGPLQQLGHAFPSKLSRLVRSLGGFALHVSHNNLGPVWRKHQHNLPHWKIAFSLEPKVPQGNHIPIVH